MALQDLVSWSWMVTALVILATVCFGVMVQSQAKRSPKGMGFLPIIGDTLELLQNGPRYLVLHRFARFGDLFTISPLDRTYTVLNSPDAVKFILSTAHSAFHEGYNLQFMEILGEGKFVDSRHPHFRKAVLNAITGDGLLELLPFINSLAERTVKSWEPDTVVDTIEELRKFAFAVMMRMLWRNVEPGSKEIEKLRLEIYTCLRGLSGVPINVPGFAYHKALQSKQNLFALIQKEINRRRASGDQLNDFFTAVMNIKEVDIPDHDICCIVMLFMIAGQATTSPFIPIVLKYLHEHPEVRQRVQEEQDCMREKMKEDKSMAWFKSKAMPYTLQVINEVLRIESMATFLPRQANRDVEYKGIVIRKNDYVWTSLSSIHLNPELYPNPHKFDPSRFEEKPKPNVFVPFGSGPHLCPGSEIAITETMFIIHHLFTNFSWEKVGRDQGWVWSFPSRLPVGGLPIIVRPRKMRS